jgi:hypothetical protein
MLRAAQIVFAMAGASLMSWGGASITARLGLEGTRHADVALFGLGIVLLSQAPYLALLERVRRLEEALNARGSGTIRP